MTTSKSILIVFESVEGHTAKIARTIAQQTEEAGYMTVLSDVREPGFAIPGTFDAVIVCGPIHMQRYPSTLARFVLDFADALNPRPSALVTVSLGAASDNEEELAALQEIANGFCASADWSPTMRHNAAGALKYVEYNYFKRLAMQYMVRREGGPVDTSQDYEYTDWVALHTFVAEFLGRVDQGM